MENKLPHIKPPKDDWNPMAESGYWEEYEITEDEIKKYLWLKTLKHYIEHTRDSIRINKDKTQVYVYNSWGDSALFNIETGKIIECGLGF